MSPAGRRALLVLLGGLGLGVYLWPAVSAPVVLWSDSIIDLGWAREGVGIVSPAPLLPGPHPAKLAYLAFLRAATLGASEAADPRRVVLLQSLMLWMSIGATSVFLGRRTTFGRGVALYVVLVLFLRLRDASSAVMSEALTAAVFLPIAAVLLAPFRPGLLPEIGLGCAVAVLFLVRPNAGGAAAALAVVAFVAAKRWRGLAYLAIGFVVIVVPAWVLTAPPGDALRGLGANFTIARTPYGWSPAAALGDAPLEEAEAGRQRVWRAFHGPLGLEFYDGRWSTAYAAAGEWARSLSPVLILAALAVLAVPSRGPLPLARPLGQSIFLIVVAQSFVLGALPRFALPLLPALFLFAVAAWPPRRAAAAAVIFLLLLSAAAWQRHVLDREWGRIESAGVRITQTIPRGALPARAPAVLRIRLAPPLPTSDAHLQVLGPAGQTLYDSRADADRSSPWITLALPPDLLEGNRRAAVALTLVSTGTYDAHSHLLFPVIPRPWGAPARREGSAELSPSTGIASGSLDWWAREGAR